MYCLRLFLCITVLITAEQCFTAECQLKAAIVVGISRLVKVDGEVKLCLFEGSKLIELIERGVQSKRAGSGISVHAVKKPEPFCSLYYVDSSAKGFEESLAHLTLKPLVIVDEDVDLEFTVKLLKAHDRYQLIVNQKRLDGDVAKLDPSILRLAFRIIKD